MQEGDIEGDGMGRVEIDRFLIKNYANVNAVWNYLKSEGNREKLVDPHVAQISGRPGQIMLQAVADLVIRPFIPHLRNPEEWLDLYVSRSFADFVKGITMFEEDCIPAEVTELSRRARNSMNCYIERLIYNHMWTNTHRRMQNDGHRVALLETERRLFKSCHHPVATIITDTNVTFGDYAIPIELKITYMQGSVIASEVYTRTVDGAMYTPDVVCIRTEADSMTNVTRSFRWVQNYQNKNPRRFADNAASTADVEASDTSLASDASGGGPRRRRRPTARESIALNGRCTHSNENIFTTTHLRH
jgi:hypothetical protein